MPAQAPDQYQAVLAYLRRKYWLSGSQTWDTAALQTLADTAYASGTQTFTFTSTASEAGGQASGEITFDTLTLLAAIEDLLEEAAPASQPPPRPRGFMADFSQRNSST